MDDSFQLTELQLAIMRVLWARGEGTVGDVRDALADQAPADRALAPTTVATMLTRLEKKGVVDHRTEGRQYVYRALVTEQRVRRSVMAEVTDRLFQGDVGALVSHLLSARDVSPGDLERVRAIIDAKEREAKRAR